MISTSHCQDFWVNYLCSYLQTELHKIDLSSLNRKLYAINPKLVQASQCYIFYESLWMPLGYGFFPRELSKTLLHGNVCFTRIHNMFSSSLMILSFLQNLIWKDGVQIFVPAIQNSKIYVNFGVQKKKGGLWNYGIICNYLRTSLLEKNPPHSQMSFLTLSGCNPFLKFFSNLPISQFLKTNWIG